LNHLLLARVALSSLCTIQAIATVGIDFNRTHATNPLWIGHARFHLVWQGSTVVFLSALELVLVWSSGPDATLGFYLAALLAALSPMGFLTAFVSRKLFGGTLSDPNGIPAARLHLFGAVRSIDMNLAAVLGALVSLSAILAVYRS
jgi:hypothetical protein